MSPQRRPDIDPALAARLDREAARILRAGLNAGDLFTAAVPAVLAWGVPWMAVKVMGDRLRDSGVAPDGLGALLFSAPWALVAWPIAVAIAWSAWKHDAANRKKLQVLAYGGSTLLFGWCLAELYTPLFKLAAASS
jgi:hypothetical protein